MSNILNLEHELNQLISDETKTSIENWTELHNKFRGQKNEILRQLVLSTNPTIKMFAKMVLKERNAIIIPNKIGA